MSNVFSPKREIIPLIGTESSWYVHLLTQTVKQDLGHFDIVFDLSLIFGSAHSRHIFASQLYFARLHKCKNFMRKDC